MTKEMDEHEERRTAICDKIGTDRLKALETRVEEVFKKNSPKSPSCRPQEVIIGAIGNIADSLDVESIRKMNVEALEAQVIEYTMRVAPTWAKTENILINSAPKKDKGLGRS
jgi:hypothetical protein